MWEDLTAPWRVCGEQAWEAYCHGSLPIGAAITDGEGRILARGRNRIYEAEAAGKFLCGSRLAHAEMNALIALDWAAVHPHACVLFTTTEPCALCTGAVRMTHLGEIRFASRDGAAGSTSLLDASPFMRRGEVRVHGPHDPRLEAVLVSMLAEFAFAEGDENSVSWCERLASTVPAGVALAHTLHTSGDLRAWRRAGWAASAVLDALAARLEG
jgi:tRNA(adenine34) deaminase